MVLHVCGVVEHLFVIDLSNFIFLMCVYSGWKSCESVPKLVDEYLAGKLKVDEFITHSFPLDKINEAFELMHAGKRLVNIFCVKLLSFFILKLDRQLVIHMHGTKFYFHTNANAAI